MKKISFKVVLLYVFIAVLNISFFTIVIFENQIDLITENTKYQAKELAQNISYSLTLVSQEIETNKYIYDTEKKIINKLTESLKKSLKEFIIFNEKSKVLYQSNKDFNMEDFFLKEGMKSITNKDYLGKSFLTKIDEKKYVIYFFIPLSNGTDSILVFKYKMKDIGERLSNLYKLIGIIIAVLILIHIGFALVLNQIIINPIKVLYKSTLEISKGNLSSRVYTKKTDEIGQLFVAFNTMALSIQQQILELQKRDMVIQTELKVASEVQSIIYPKLQNSKFDLAVSHRPYEQVSGDYYDFFQISDKKFGFLIADVCGHGIPAALITMLVKNMFKRYIKDFDDPKDLFNTINANVFDLLNEYTAFFTAFCLIIDENYNIIYSNGGHCPALLLKNNSDEIIELTTDGFVLGITKDIPEAYFSSEYVLEKDDKIILFTDGISESKDKNGKLLGSNSLKEIINRNRDNSSTIMLNKILDDFNQCTDNKKPQDDATIFIIGVK
ncbi:MAG: hypothetical protein A2086_13870 [Spirochaetes bacterium GWD1_27_9]|nr:MAG: hypothetical protein A2086_13870 [Spirochaetes bacterium GWD1_27_9]